MNSYCFQRYLHVTECNGLDSLIFHSKPPSIIPPVCSGLTVDGFIFWIKPFVQSTEVNWLFTKLLTKVGCDTRLFLMWGAHIYIYGSKDKNYCPSSATTVMPVLVSTNFPILVQWGRCCNRIRILYNFHNFERNKEQILLFHPNPKAEILNYDHWFTKHSLGVT